MSNQYLFDIISFKLCYNKVFELLRVNPICPNQIIIKYLIYLSFSIRNPSFLSVLYFIL